MYDLRDLMKGNWAKCLAQPDVDVLLITALMNIHYLIR